MADTKTTNLSRLVLKQAGRAKEKILQNLGKSDKTTDEIFEEHLTNFNAQQVNATRLHKDINNYLRCIRAMQTASKNLMDTLSDIYEKEWIGQDMLHVQAQNNEMLWADLAHKLTDQVVTPLNTYQAQFPEMRKKIDKRGRKLIDYDAERHNVQQMQNNPNRNEAKYIRAKEQMENAKRTYEVLNSELHDELPALFDSRVIFLVTNMQTLFAAEEVFHSETSKVFSELETVVDKLSKEVQKGTLPRRSMNRALPLEHNSAPIIQNSSMNSPPKATNGSSSMGGGKYRGHSPTKDYEVVGADRSGHIGGFSDRYISSSTAAKPDRDETGGGGGRRISGDENGHGDSGFGGGAPARGGSSQEIPPGASTDNMPPGVLYKVKAAYKYQAEDVDELSFEVGEVIQVIEYEDPEEQEEGWLMGVKESTGQKGLFPANFTRPM